MFHLALAASILIQSVSILMTDGSTLLPNPLHCLTTLYMTGKPQQYNNTAKESISNNPVDLYHVEEFVDFHSRRSTVSNIDVARNETRIYYNQVGSDESSERSFSSYNPHAGDCMDELITSWPLVSLRDIAINLGQSTANINREHVDVSIGPSSLLYAIENNLSSFVFKSRIFSKSKMTNVDVFAKEIKLETFNGSEDVSIIVHLMAPGRNRPNEGETLENDYDEDASLSIVLIGACKTGSRDNLEVVRSHQPGEKASKKNDQLQQHSVHLQVNEDTFCEHGNLLFTIHYHIVSLYTPTTLVGVSLEDFGQSAWYHFQLEPFMKPVGIGCLADSDSSKTGWQKSLSRGGATFKFSAEYVSLYGEPGVSYVAFDDRKGLVRLDEAGRKSIYDISNGIAYHIGTFPQTTKHDEASDDRAGHRNEKKVAQCVVLHLSDGSSPIKLDGYVRRYMLGLGQGFYEHYLGSRLLDHVNYEVFEKEWLDKTQLPLILRSAKYPGLNPTENKPLFLTYYAQTIASDSDDGETLLLSFIEVWEFDSEHRERRLINRVKFLEFSWDLDIEPPDEPASQKLGYIETRVFQVEPCHRNRASQAELVIKFIREPSDATIWPDNSRDRQYLIDCVNNYLSIEMHVSSLNLVDTEAKVLDSGDILATTRIVELRSSVSTMHLLGSINYQPGDLTEYIERIVLNRHSKDECRLESISEPTANWFAYCPKLAICLIQKQSGQLKSKLASGLAANVLLANQKQKQNSSLDGAMRDTCALESLSYKTVDVGETRMNRNALEQAFDFVTATRAKTRIKRFIKRFRFNSAPYRAEVIAFKQLDSIGTRLTNDVSLLSNFRHSTQEEEPSSVNLNKRIAGKIRMGALRFCQLACQLDDFCGSFSMCSRSTSDDMEQADCVLSAVRLTGERLNRIMEASTDIVLSNLLKIGRREKKFQVNLSDETHSQTIIMYRDDSCSLHSKDFLAEYHIERTWRGYEKISPQLVDIETEEPKLPRRYLDLDDCAGLNFELEQFNDPVNSNFTYCPLNSHCIPGVDDFSSQTKGTTEYCYFYKRHATRAYNKQPMMHMIAIKLDSASSGQLQSSTDKKAKQHVDSLLDRLDLLESHVKSEGKQLAMTSWVSSERDCARDCNMHQSRCLAFDSCRRNDRVLCILYSKRSPLMRDSARFPLLKQERDSMAKYRTGLDANEFCDHYYLKEDYFEVRLNTMQAEEQQGSANRENDRRQQAINELEEKIDLENRGQNDHIVSSLIEDLKQMADHEIKYEHQGFSGNHLIHLMSLLIGLFVGAVSILYRQQVLDGVSSVYKIYKEKRARSDSLNEFVLTDQNEQCAARQATSAS